MEIYSKCIKCGYNIKGNSEYCENCGYYLGDKSHHVTIEEQKTLLSNREGYSYTDELKRFANGSLIISFTSYILLVIPFISLGLNVISIILGTKSVSKYPIRSSIGVFLSVCCFFIGIVILSVYINIYNQVLSQDIQNTIKSFSSFMS